MLQKLTGDVQTQVRRVHHAPDEPEILRQEVRALVHDEHSAGIELQARLKVLGVVIEGLLGGNEQQGFVGHRALGGHRDHPLGLGIVVELVPIEFVIFLFSYFGFLPLPDGDHGIQSLHLAVSFVFRLVVGGTLLFAGLADLHTDGKADVIGVFAHQLLKPPLLQELAEFLIVGVETDVHDDVGADAVPFTFRDGIAIRAGRLPHIGRVGAIFLRHHRDVVGDHKRGVEPNAELTDDVGILRVIPKLLFELEGPGGGDDAQVVVKILPVHADAVVRDGEKAGILVRLDLNFKILAVKADAVVGQRFVAKLIACVAGVGDDLPKKNLVMGVDGVYHQIQQPLGFCLELFFCHGLLHSFFIFQNEFIIAFYQKKINI